ncbi:MAG: NUDIX domain-containing protein [Haloarculaceae archaeon]
MEEYAYVVNVEAAVVRNGTYLCIERSAQEEHAAGQLGFPGGKVEQPPGNADPVEATARREVREEVGVEVSDVSYVRSRTFETEGGIPCLNVVTRCEYRCGEARPREPKEVAAVHWLGPTAVADHEACPPYLEADVEAVESHRTTSG